MHAAFGHERAAGGAAALVGGEEQHGARDLFGAAVAVVRDQAVEQLGGVAPEGRADAVLDLQLEGVVDRPRGRGNWRGCVGNGYPNAEILGRGPGGHLPKSEQRMLRRSIRPAARPAGGARDDRMRGVSASASQTIISTADAASGDRLAIWGEVLWLQFGSLQSEAYGDPQFDGRLEMGALEDLRLCRINAARHMVIRTRREVRRDGCGKGNLHKLFRDEAETLGEYIWQARLARSITEIAFSWGFNISPHFSRVFKERYGLSPRGFRMRALGGR